MDQFPPIYLLATGMFRVFVFPFRGGITAKGVHHVPDDGGMILAPVHLSELDPPALAVTLRKRRLRAMAKEELWNNRLFGAIIQGIGAFPVKRGAGDTESIRKCIAILQNGEAVIVFPEGHRNDGQTLNPMLPGVAMLAKRTNVPVVPAGISGTQKGSRGGVSVSYGKPLYYEDFKKYGADREVRQAFLAELELRIVTLCAEEGAQLKSATSTPHLPGC